MKQIIVTLALLALSIDVNAYDFVTKGVFYNILSSNQVEVTYEYQACGAYEGDVVIPQSMMVNHIMLLELVIGHLQNQN